jgi:hypothetical protein
MVEMFDSLPEERRREAFAALVEEQDRGASVAESRRTVASRFGISQQGIARIEREGMDNDWPPL